MSEEPTPSATASAPPPPSAAPSRPTPRRLTRSRSQRVVAGVAGGLGEYFGVDPVVFRIGFVALTLLGGSGILLYVIGWLAIPEEGRSRSIGHATVRRGLSGSVLGVVLLVLAGVLLLHETVDIGAGRFTVSLALIAGGALLLLNRPGDRDPEPSADAPPPSTPPPAPPATSVGEASAPPPPPPRPPRTRSALGRATVAAVLVIWGAIGLVDATDAVDASPDAYLVSALLVTGFGLIVGAWWGRSRGLILLGAILAVGAAGASAIDVELRGGFGERFHAPLDLSELDRDYHLVAGEMTLDLTRLDLRGRVTEVDATVGFGELKVTVPDDVRVIVHAETDAGEVTVFGQTDHQGLGSDVRRTSGPRGRGTLRLNLDVGAGQITVRDEPSRHRAAEHEGSSRGTP